MLYFFVAFDIRLVDELQQETLVEILTAELEQET